MRFARVTALLFLATFILAPCLADAGAAEFPLKEGDTWVMVGDSITAQHLHSNYFEAFCFARYPKLTFRFRNSGVGGDTIPRVMARYDWDVAPWKPTVVSVELGMNDKGGSTVEQFIGNMKQLNEKIKAGGARPIYFTASPVNNGDTSSKLGGNTRLHDYAVALKSFASENKASYADQFHAVLDIWGKNKPKEVLASSLGTLRPLAKDDKLAGVEHLRAFLAVQDKSEQRLVTMMGDPVHPGPTGQLTMAAALLKELGADGFVSSATLDAAGKSVEVKGCAVTNVKAEQNKLTFDRLDETLPFPIPDEARAVLPLFPAILELSQYTLKVTGLSEGRYTLTVDGKVLATVTAKELEKGVNLTEFAAGPIADQGKALLAAVAAKEGVVGQWRGLSRTASVPGADPAQKDKLAALTKQVEAADVKIREASKAKKLHFELAPAK